MASKVPAVASRIPSTVEISNWGGGGGGVSLVPPGDVRAFAEAAEALLSNPAAWREARRRGWQTAQRYRPEEVAPRLDEGVRWAIRSKETER
jgi:glycosyltransferase involved in cell wall biosynthesis